MVKRCKKCKKIVEGRHLFFQFMVDGKVNIEQRLQKKGEVSIQKSNGDLKVRDLLVKKGELRN
jgi:hypothetical protein